MGDADADAAREHHEAAAQAVHEDQGKYGEDEIDGASDNNVEENVVGSVAGAAVNLGGVVEQDIDAGLLLERSERDTRWREHDAR